MFKHYLVAALRHFARHKVTTSINVVCLTIGLVCFLASYSMVTFLSSGDLHYPNADRIHVIRWAQGSSMSASAAPFQTGKYLRADLPELETVARATIDVGIRNQAPVSAGDRKSFAHIAYADPELLDVFALPFLAGDSRNALRAPRSAVVSKEFAEKFFGGASTALGRSLRFQDGKEVTVRGVVGDLKQPSHITTATGPSIGQLRFEVLASMDVLEATPAYLPVLNTWSTPLFLTYAVLPKDGSFTTADLQRRLATFGERHANANGNTYTFSSVPVSDYWLSNVGVLSGSGAPSRAGVMMFYFLGIVVLLISCLNYANLATAQGSSRAKEIGMRRVVGANRWQMAVQFFSEAAVHTVLALVCAVSIVALSVWASGLGSLGAVVLATIATFQFWATLATVLGLVTLAAGFYPALVLSGVRPIQAIRTGKVRGVGRLMSRLLVGVQFAATSFLVIAMLVMVQQNARLKEAQHAYSASTLVSIGNDVFAARVDFDALKAELERQPHVEAVTATMISPWVLVGSQGVVALSPDVTATKLPVMMNRIHHDFFSTMDIGFLAGRSFDRARATDEVGTQQGVIVDRAFAELRGWNPVNTAVGKTLFVLDSSSPGRALQRTIIGVVESRASSIISPFGATGSVYELSPRSAAAPIVRINTNDIAAALKEIESVWNRFAPSVALKLEFADQVLESNHRVFRIASGVFAGVSAFALAISLLGLIGMSIDVIGRRRHEIGVRKTLGASVHSIVRLLLLDFSKPVLVANLVAWPLAFVVMQAYLNIFTARTSLSVLPFVASLVCTVFIAWVAVAAQATRAARVNPATVLRYE